MQIRIHKKPPGINLNPSTIAVLKHTASQSSTKPTHISSYHPGVSTPQKACYGSAQGVCAAHQNNVCVTGVSHPQAAQASRSRAAEGADAAGKLTSTALPRQGLFWLGACGGWFVCLWFCLLVSSCFGFFVVGCGGFVGFLLIAGVYFGCFVEP